MDNENDNANISADNGGWWDTTKTVAASAGITMLHGAAWGAGIAAGIVGVTWAAGKLGLIETPTVA